MRETAKRSSAFRVLLIVVVAAWIMAAITISDWWVVNNRKNQALVEQRMLALESLQGLVGHTRYALGMQIQEWKDILIRGHYPSLRQHHLESFRQRDQEVDQLLDAAGLLAVQEKNLHIAQAIRALKLDHQQLTRLYWATMRHYDVSQFKGAEQADNSILGIDRAIQSHFVQLSEEMDGYVTKQTYQLAGFASEKSQVFPLHLYLLIALMNILALALVRIYRVNRLEVRAGNRATVVMASIGDGVVVTDRKGGIEYLNAMAESFLGRKSDNVVGKSFVEVFDITQESTGLPARNPVDMVLQNGQATTLENGAMLRHSGGTKIPIEDSAAPVFEAGKLTGVVMVFHDMTPKYTMMKKLREEHRLFESLFNQPGVGVIYSDYQTGKVTLANGAAGLLLGLSVSELKGLALSDFYAVDTHYRTTFQPANEALHDFFEGPEVGAEQASMVKQGEALLCPRGGEPRWCYQTDTLLFLENGPTVTLPVERFYLISQFVDIHDKKMAQQRIETFAYQDELTGMFNRTHLKAQLEQIIHQSHQKPFALILIDLDHFKEVNDLHGHLAGDSLLQEISARIRNLVRPQDMVVRLGGDEFVVVLWDIDQAGCLRIAQKLCTELHGAMVISNQEIMASASIGVSFYPQDGGDFQTLLRRADMAMYKAKSQGRNQVLAFTPDMENLRQEEYQLEADIRHGIERQEFALFLQPKVFLDTGGKVGAEALIRWNHPTKGLIMPLNFIPLAERSSLILALGNWVIEESCRLLRELLNQGVGNFKLSFNVSPRQLLEEEALLACLSQAMKTYSIPPNRLVMEITESALMNDQAVHTANKVHALGVQLSLDDFGTGYSSLSLLQRMPFSTIKIDRSFIDGLGRNETDEALVRAVLGIGQDLGLQVVAEGVETEPQVEKLKRYGCQIGQGYLFGKPAPFSTMNW